MNNKYQKIYFVPLSLLLLAGCTALSNPSLITEETENAGTRSEESNLYYWYRGERIPLATNKEYVNVLLSDSVVTDSVEEQVFNDLDLYAEGKYKSETLVKARFNKAVNNPVDYYARIQTMRDDERTLGVFPFFERGHGAKPIGTSDIFYVKLKGIEHIGLSTDAQEYNIDSIRPLVQETKTTIVGKVPYMPNWYVVSIKGSVFETSIEASNYFYESGYVSDVDPAFMFEFRTNATNDPLFSLQWGLKNTTNPGYDINVEGAWALTTGAGTKIAIVDQGIDLSHDDLASNIASWSYDAQSGTYPSLFITGNYHGTHVAGIAAAVGNNNLQIAGVAYDSRIIPVSHDLFPSSTVSAELASGISWAWQTGADVINNSWGDQGGLYYNDVHTTLLENAIEGAMLYGRSDRGTVVVFAAGNYGMNGAVMDYPASYDERLLTVGSIGKTGYRSWSSGYGSELDIVAPGENILSTMPEDIVDYKSGTSMAAPHVSGVAALVIAENPELPREEVVRLIQHTAQKISPGEAYVYLPKNYMFLEETWNQEVGYGLVDATAAVSMAHIMGSASSPNYTGMTMVLPSGPSGNQHLDAITGGPFPLTVYASLLPAQVNPAYTYYWFITVPFHPEWKPSLLYTIGSQASISIPEPTSTGYAMHIRCLVFNGSTLIDVPSYTLYVDP